MKALDVNYLNPPKYNHNILCNVLSYKYKIAILESLGEILTVKLICFHISYYLSLLLGIKGSLFVTSTFFLFYVLIEQKDNIKTFLGWVRKYCSVENNVSN